MTHKELVEQCKKWGTSNIFDLNTYRRARDINPDIKPPRKPEPRRFKTDRERVARGNKPSHW